MATLWTNARVVTMARGAGGDFPRAPEPGAVEVLTDAGRIVAVGPDLTRDGVEVFDCGGRLMTPALIDCHTHLVHGGDRAREFEMRLDGATYEEIAREGGGIKASMRATRAMDVDALVAASLPRPEPAQPAATPQTSAPPATLAPAPGPRRPVPAARPEALSQADPVSPSGPGAASATR